MATARSTALLAAGLALGAALAWPAMPRAAERLPLFDAHIHYSQSAWQEFPVQTVLKAWDEAGIERAIVSSTPDDGTLKLYDAAPQRVVPFLRPYRGQWGTANWFQDPGLLDYLRARLAKGVHKGIGEFHLFDPAAADTPTVRAVARLAVERDLWMLVHSGAEAVSRLASAEPRAKIIWAHLGMSESPATVDATLARFPGMWSETSFRDSELYSGGAVDPAWKAVLIKYKDRLMVGSDTYIPERWDGLAGLAKSHRTWLDLLPRDVAEQLAWRNAARLFGTGGRAALEK